MSKIRVVNTRFWIDDYISNLDPIEKLLFLYFLTNPMTDICGIYEIPLKIVAVETGIDKEMVIKILGRFERDGKIFYQDGWVGIKNFQKHQSINPKVKKGMEVGLTKAPKGILDRLSIDYPSLSHSNPNPNININTKVALKTQEKTKFSIKGAEVLKSFEEVDPKNKNYYNNKTQRKACDFLIEEYGFEDVIKAIKLLPKINQKKLFIGQTTTPYELQQNWIKIGNAIKQEKSDTRNKPNYFL